MTPVPPVTAQYGCSLPGEAWLHTSTDVPPAIPSTRLREGSQKVTLGWRMAKERQ